MCNGIEQFDDVVRRWTVFLVEGGIDQVDTIEEIVGKSGRWDNGVFDIAAQGELQHGFGIGNVGNEDTRSIEQVYALAILCTVNDLDAC